MFVIIIHPLLLPHTEICWLAAVLTVQHICGTVGQTDRLLACVGGLCTGGCRVYAICH